MCICVCVYVCISPAAAISRMCLSSLTVYRLRANARTIHFRPYPHMHPVPLALNRTRTKRAGSSVMRIAKATHAPTVGPCTQCTLCEVEPYSLFASLAHVTVHTRCSDMTTMTNVCKSIALLFSACVFLFFILSLNLAFADHRF